MLTQNQLRSYVSRFGVPDEQIVRDHLISHILHVLPELGGEVIFFGGTALCRTHLIDWRLSEDIGLLVDDAAAWVEALEALPRLLRREFPGLIIAWRPEGLTTIGIAEADDVAVQLQLVPTDSSYERYPTKPTTVQLRYPDLPSDVVLAAPTLIGATAMKLNAWAHRAAPRDLADLYAIVLNGELDSPAVELAHEVSAALVPASFAARRIPSDEEWITALQAQMPEVPDLATVFDVVREAVIAAAGWDPVSVR